MKKTIVGTLIAATLGLVSAGASAAPVAPTSAPITVLHVTYGDFGINESPTQGDGVNDWSGDLQMGVAGTLIPNAFDLYGLLGPVDVVADGSGLSGNTGSDLDFTNFAMNLTLQDFSGNTVGSEYIVQSNASPDATFGPNNTFSVDFTAPIASDLFGPNATGYWHMEGTYETSAVPLPTAAWLLGSGLLGLFVVGRRKAAS